MIDRAAKELLRQHQAIIDAWFARWLEQERARIDAAFARESRVQGCICPPTSEKTCESICCPRRNPFKQGINGVVGQKEQ